MMHIFGNNRIPGKGRKWLLLSLLVVNILACDSENKQETSNNQAELLIYCGITMANPMQEIARNFEKSHNVKITITQGGSEDLYQSLKVSQKGDLYLPGSASYRKRHLKDGLLTDFIVLGYNQAALLVKKGNPEAIDADLKNLLRSDLQVVIGSHESGSIGKESKTMLEKLGIYDEVVENAVYLTSDSRTLNHALKKDEADIIINWEATAYFDNNRNKVDVIALPPDIAKPKQLILNQLTFSKYPELGSQFMQYAASAEGNAIFQRFGFLIPSDVK